MKTKLYRHYKNKDYKYLGEAKHSETLEEMVVYETRHENELGRLWVRPKAMFHEAVEIEGRSTPRFRNIPIEIEETTDITEKRIETIAPLIEKCFGEWDPNWFNSRLSNHKKFYLITASAEQVPIAFKLGYETDRWEFYSWLGAVLPEWRGLGIAGELMRVQHEWCRKQDYSKVSTKTQNRFREMLLLNIKSGFDVLGTHLSSEGGLKIVLEKSLRP